MLHGGDVLVVVVWQRIIVKATFDEGAYDFVDTLLKLIVFEILENGSLVEELNRSLFLLASFRNIISWPSVDSSPVAHHEAFETHDVPEMVVEGDVVGTGVNVVDFVVTAHGGADSGLDGLLERWVVHFHLVPLVDVGTLDQSGGLLIIIDEVLHIGEDAIALDTQDERVREIASEGWIFAGDILESSTVIGNTHDVEAWAEVNSSTLILELFAHFSSPLEQENIVPGGAESQA